jgi:ankyrin repeat protein
VLRLNQKGLNCLHVAVVSQDVDPVTVRLILKYVPVDEPTEDESSSLMLAVANRRSAIVEVLLRSGANINQRNEKNSTPLFLALFSPDEGILRSVLEYAALEEGGLGNLSSFKDATTGFTPLQYFIPF